MARASRVRVRAVACCNPSIQVLLFRSFWRQNSFKNGMRYFSNVFHTHCVSVYLQGTYIYLDMIGNNTNKNVYVRYRYSVFTPMFSMNLSQIQLCQIQIQYFSPRCAFMNLSRSKIGLGLEVEKIRNNQVTLM